MQVNNKKTFDIKNNFGWTMAEMIIVFFIASVLITSVYSAKKVIQMSKLASAVNITGQADFVDRDDLVLWLETSSISKNVAKVKNDTDDNFTTWNDLSKNQNKFSVNSGNLKLNKSTMYPAIKSFKFDGTHYFTSSSPLNLEEYTAIIVAKGINSPANGKIIDSGLVITSGEIGNNNIVIITNNGTTKESKLLNATTSDTIASHSDNLDTSPTNMHIGNNGFKGEILEIIIFDKAFDFGKMDSPKKEDLVHKEFFQKMEEYLNSKYRK